MAGPEEVGDNSERIETDQGNETPVEGTVYGFNRGVLEAIQKRGPGPLGGLYASREKTIKWCDITGLGLELIISKGRFETPEEAEDRWEKMMSEEGLTYERITEKSSNN